MDKKGVCSIVVGGGGGEWERREMEKPGMEIPRGVVTAKRGAEEKAARTLRGKRSFAFS